MIKLIISCGLGMSSSAIAQHMQKEILEKKWEHDVSVEFVPFPLLMENQNRDCDLVLLCPHLMYYAKNATTHKGVKIPMYIIPSLMYGTMNLEHLMEDAQDLLKLYADSDEILYHFPEEKLLDIKRNTSHRRWIKTHPVNQ